MRKIKQQQDKKSGKTSDVRYYIHFILFLCIAAAVIIGITVVIPLIKKTSLHQIINYDRSEAEIVFTDKDTGVYYVPCSRSLSPRNPGKAYAAQGKTTFYRLYTVNGEKVDPKKYISDDYGMVYRNRDTAEITLESFNAIGAYVFHNDVATGGELYPKKELLPESEQNRENIPDDTELTNETVRSVLSSQELFPTGEIVDDDTFELKLCSSDYPEFYYSLFCMRDENGAKFVYDPATNSYHGCPAELAVKMWGND